MKAKRSTLGVAVAACALALTACGGGGGNNDTGGGTPNPSTFPASGRYAVDLTAQGATTSPQFGVSLIHPAARSVEYVIEPPSAGVSDLIVVSSGRVDAAQATISEIEPYAALYIVAGDVRRVPLVANGTAPLTRVQKAGSTDACKFVVKADDYSAPDRSRYIVSTKGVDNVCGSADDGQAEVVLDASGGLAVIAITGAKRLALTRDSASLAPRGWITTESVVFWAPSGAVLPIQPAPSSVVIETYKSALVEMNGGLGIIDFIATGVGTGLSTTLLDAGSTAGTGWKSIGFDASHYYVYRNSGSTPVTSAWSVLKIDRASAAVTQLASGSGLLSSAGMGTNLLYATELGVSANRLLRIDKTVAGPAQVVEQSPTATIASITTSANGAHALWRRPVSGSGTGFAIEIVDEAGLVRLAVPGGYPLSQPDPSALNLATSENHTQFVFASGYGATAFNGAELQTYDASAARSVILGNLPGASRYGADPVSVGVTGSSAPFMAGYAGRVIGGSLQAADAVAFSFDVRTPASLEIASSRQ